MIVYRVINCLNNKVYFAVSSRSFNQIATIQLCNARAARRKMKLKDDYTGKSPFHKALLKNGEFNFKYELLHDRVSRKKAYAYKIQYIKDYHAMNPKYGYNCTTGGIDSFNHADHVIDRLKISQTGKKMPESYVKLMKARVGELHPAFGFKHSKEVRARMSQAQKDSDYVQSEESKKRTSETMKKRWQEPEIIAKMAKRERGEVTEETRRKLSKANSGKNNAMYGVRGKDHPSYGTTISKDQKQKMANGRIKFISKQRKKKLEIFKNRTEKKCSKCKIVMSLDMFYKSKNTLDGYISACNSCEQKRTREKYYRLHSKNKIKNRYGKLIKDVIKEKE